MRCTDCNKLLSDAESTQKNKQTGGYLDMCNDCLGDAIIEEGMEYDEDYLDLEEYLQAVQETGEENSQ
jgi:NAD-dependent SIR2 family protein deacetylase